jgi:protein-S-isoprenylcysteine O-methyltransferase Ste14
MNYLSITLLLVFFTTFMSFIWARLRFFKIETPSSRISSLMYDPVVGIHVVVTLFSFSTGKEFHASIGVLVLLLYSLGVGLFWWAALTAKQLEFAFSSNVGNVVITGPFAIVRHPFYLSYTLIWLANSLLFNSIYLWITLIYLTAFYINSAQTEEKVYLKSRYSKEYQDYSQNVGMFLPRILKWKN